MSAASPRIAWIDHARAAGILLVVAGHAIRSIERSGLETPPLFAAADGAIYSFHMPLFFMLAGMTQSIAPKKRTGSALTAAFWGIALPYLLWSTIWFALKAIFAGAANLGMQASLVSILWSPVDHFWFLYVLLILRLAWIALEATGSRLLQRLAVLVPLVVAFVGGGPADGMVNAFLFFWAAFYGVGVLAGDAVGRLSRPALAAGALAAGTVWILILLTVPTLLDGSFGPARTIAALAGSAALIAALAAIAPGGIVGRIVGFVGEASLAIFLTHTLFGAAARVLLGKLGLLTPEALVAAATVAGIVGPLALYAGVLRLGLVSGRPLARWVGLGTQRRSHWFDLGPRRADRLTAADRAS